MSICTVRRISALMLLLLTALVVPSLPAVGRPPETRLVEVPIGSWQSSPSVGVRSLSAGDVAGADWAHSDAVGTEDLVLVGARWDGREEQDVQIRVRRDGSWQDWQQLDPTAAIEGEVAPDTTMTEPLWVAGAEAVQIRTRGGSGGRPELVGVEVTGGEGLGYQPGGPAPSAASAAPARPAIVPRTSWDPKGDCQPRRVPSYASQVRFAVVHHTAGSNDYAPEEADDIVRAICLYHVNGNGWNDLGYQFLVDRYGNAYEGRAGGVTEPVVGAHTTGFNDGSTGIAVLGNFVKVDPPPAVIGTLDRLLAWKLDLHHVDPEGTTDEVAGGGTHWPRGTEVTIPTIVTHRDLNATADPGRLYDWIGGTRPAGPRVAAIGGQKLYGGLPPTVDQPVLGDRPRFSVRLRQAADWRLEISDPTGGFVRSASGGPAQQADLSWDLRDADGQEIPPGNYTARFTSGDASPISTRFTVRPSTERLAGSDGVATSVATSRWAFEDPQRQKGGWPQADSVVIASSVPGARESFLAPALAASYDAPVLLSPSAGLPDTVAAEIRRLGAKRAYVVGGLTELSGQVESDLRSKGGVTTVDRRAGETPYYTSGRVAWRIVERERPREAVLVLGEGPDPEAVEADALVAAAYAAALGLPVLYVLPDELPEAARWVLEQRSWDRLTVVGGAGILGPGVRSEASTAAGGVPIVELAGPDRYVTARKAADEVLRRRAAAHTDVASKGSEAVITGGQAGVLGLPAAAAASERAATFTLVPPRDLGSAPDIRDWFDAHRSALVYVTVVGSADAVDPNVVAEIDRMIRSAGPHLGAQEAWKDGSGGAGFSDIAASPHRDAIERIVAEGISRGCDSTRYCPQDPVTRGQMASFIARAQQLAPVSGQRFSDVPPDHLHAEAINAITEAGIARGFDDGTFRPQEPVSRGQMATFLAIAMDLAPRDEQRFEDVPAGYPHAGTINAVAEVGVSVGCASDRFCPHEPVTRAQMASFLSRALDGGL